MKTAGWLNAQSTRDVASEPQCKTYLAAREMRYRYAIIGYLAKNACRPCVQTADGHSNETGVRAAAFPPLGARHPTPIVADIRGKPVKCPPVSMPMRQHLAHMRAAP